MTVAQPRPASSLRFERAAPLPEAGPSLPLLGQCGVVTGAASGIGLAIAERLRADGAQVLAVDQIYEQPGECELNCDLLDPAANAAAVEAACERFGRLDFLVPNAGFQYVSPVRSFPEERFEAVQQVLLRSPFLLAKHAWDELVRSRGAIVAIASAHGLVASPYKTAYVAAKHGVVGLVKSLALEGAAEGVRVNAVCPGVVRTPLVEKQLADQAEAYGVPVERVLEDVMLAPHAVKRLIEPGEVAAVVSFLLSEDARAITGVALPVDLGWTAR
jgi:3-hydroxybutyrate dehydrogenase